MPPEASLAYLSSFKAANMTRMQITFEHIINSGRRWGPAALSLGGHAWLPRQPATSGRSAEGPLSRAAARSLSTYTYIRAAVNSVFGGVSLALGQMTLATAPVAVLDPTFLLQPVAVKLTDTHPVRLYGERAGGCRKRARWQSSSLAGSSPSAFPINFDLSGQHMATYIFCTLMWLGGAFCAGISRQFKTQVPTPASDSPHVVRPPGRVLFRGLTRFG